MRRFIIGVAALGVLSAPPTAVGQAATEPCDPARIALLRISAPAEVAVGRPARATEKEGHDWDWFLDRETVRGSFVPAVAEGALAFGYRDMEPTDSYPPAWPIRFAEGDGSAVVGVAYEEYRFVSSGEERCRRLVTTAVNPIEGRPPSLSRSVWSGGGEVQISIDKPFRWKCLRAAAGPVRVTFRGPGGARTVAINDQCGHLTTTGGRRRGWRLRGRLRYGTFDATFKDLFRQTGQRTFRYKARFGGQTLASGRFIVRTKRTPGYRIYEGTDAFINVCINDLRRIWSSGGRLYCDEPPHVSRRIAFTRR
jgi:hypothetical protein